MFRRSVLSTAIVMAGSLWVGTALANTDSGAPFSSAAEINKVSEWMGKGVQDNEGNKIGEITDFALNLEDSSIAYAVVDVSSMFNDKAIAVPLAALSTSAESDDELVLQVSQSEWKSAKTFTDDNWPLTASLAAGTGKVATSMATDKHGNEATDARQQPARDLSGQSAGTVSSSDSKVGFDALNTDGNDYLSQEEYQGAVGAHANDGTDQNQDGRITRSEFAAFEASERENWDQKETSTDDRSGEVDPDHSPDSERDDDVDLDK